MRRVRALVASVTAGASTLAAISVGESSAVETPAGQPPKVVWQKCATVSDEDIEKLAGSAEPATVKKQLARRECGFVNAPLNYAEPDGKQVRIAITRFKATGPQSRGALAVNRGGPGATGVLFPLRIARFENGELAQKFDLIGFDPRGLGESTPTADCQPGEPQEPKQTPSDQEIAQAVAEFNKACAESDPALMASLTTANMARDMDRIRAALGVPKISYLGFSWGTALGANYRSLFPQQVDRMVLDSPMSPDIRLDRYADDEAEAKEFNAHRFAAWISKYDELYGLGGSKTEVEANVKQLRRFFGEGKKVPGIGKAVTASGIGTMMLAESLHWAQTASQLSDFAKFAEADGPGGPPAGGEPPPADPYPEPEEDPKDFSLGVNRAVWCNEERGPRDFQTWTRLREQRIQRFPLAGGQAGVVPMCIGWTLPLQPWALRRDAGPLLVVAHAFESITPGKWIRDFVGSIGGTALIAEDDLHASAFDGDCSDTATGFLTGGDAPATGARCDGLGEPEPKRFPPTVGASEGVS